MSLSDILAARGFTPHPNSRAASSYKRQGVQSSMELDRILALPRRNVDLSSVPDLTPVWAKPEGKLKLWPIQSWALFEAEKAGGIFGSMSVGSGKTIVSILAVDALNAKLAVLLVPPQLRNQLLYRDIPYYGKHLHLEGILPRLKIVAYSELSSPRKAEILDELKPDLIIADEAHNLRDKGSARSKRFLRYFKDNPNTKFVALSGTMTRRSILDYAHLIQLALKDGSPIPRGFRERKDWAEALDVSDDPMPPGQLINLCNESDVYEGEQPGCQESVRRGFRRRLVETVGVVSTSEDALGTSLIIQALYPEVPNHLQSRLQSLRLAGEHEGEVVEDSMALYRIGKQLSCGFYYRWVWPDDKPDYEWLEARANWHRELRGLLSHNRKGLDSPFLVATAAVDGRIETKFWKPWSLVKDRPAPPVEAVWLDDFLIKECDVWKEEILKTNESGVIWYEFASFGERLALALKLPFFGPGDEASKRLTTVDASKDRVIVASIAAHGEGKNLQMYSRMLVTSAPSSGKTWEQLCGRLHRPGQESDDVIVSMFLHTEEGKNCFDNATKEARYVEQSQGMRQKLLLATRIMK